MERYDRLHAQPVALGTLTNEASTGAGHDLTDRTMERLPANCREVLQPSSSVSQFLRQIKILRAGLLKRLSRPLAQRERVRAEGRRRSDRTQAVSTGQTRKARCLPPIQLWANPSWRRRRGTQNGAAGKGKSSRAYPPTKAAAELQNLGFGWMSSITVRRNADAARLPVRREVNKGMAAEGSGPLACRRKCPTCAG